MATRAVHRRRSPSGRGGRRRRGPLPLALRACLTEVGGVDLRGDCDDLPGVSYHAHSWIDEFYPDPLILPTASWLRHELIEKPEELERLRLESPQLVDDGDKEHWRDFMFAPDELHKANVSGSSHDIRLPSRTADPALEGVRGRPTITLLGYLRLSFAWGGFPGYGLRGDGPRPALLDTLRADLVPF